MDKKIEIFIDKYVKAIREENAAIFAGAGLSYPCGMVDWRSFLRDIAKELGLDIDIETDLISIAQYYKNEKENRGELNQKLIDEFSKNTALSDNHKILASLPIKTYWTTNYDKLIEYAIERNHKKADVKIANENFSYNVPKRDVVIYKMHGDISLPHDAVLIKEDYEDYNEKKHVFTIALQGDLITKTFLFIGFSFDDPNLEYILSRVRILLGKNKQQHYCFLKKISRDGFKNDEDYSYAKIKQDLKIKDLKRYSIEALLIDNYDDITDILRKIKKELSFREVLISGATVEYGTWEKAEAESLVYNIAKALANHNYKITTGFGVDIGSWVINGVLSYVYSTNTIHLDDYLTMRPFPQNIDDENERRKLFTKYREGMLENVGIALFFFGNKISGKDIIESDGMWEEFEIASRKGIIIIPIGSTGYMAKKIWDTVMEDQDKYYPRNKEIRDNIERLGAETDIGKIIDLVINTLELIERN